jgi:hypothetical protein
VTARYAAYALALKLKFPDVDAMLASMSITSFMEWQAFFRIREEERAKDKGQPGAPAKQVRTLAEAKQLNAKNNSVFDAIVQRQNKAKGRRRR